MSNISHNLAEEESWRAELALTFATDQNHNTVLTHNRHEGPLRVQKPLYPEGRSICQAIVLHPPSGMVGGDELHILVNVEAQAQVQLTTPGAGKWYRSNGKRAAQSLEFNVAEGAMLEWLPQETMLFNGAQASMSTDINLQAQSRFVGWEVLCLGRRASGEILTQGECATTFRLHRAGGLMFIERGAIQAGQTNLTSAVGWAGKTVSATMVASFPALAEQPTHWLALARAVVPPIEEARDGSRRGITYLPAPRTSASANPLAGLLVARYLGDHPAEARAWLTDLWRTLRSAYVANPAVLPRIWRT
jgi:urease accessory protein